MKTKLRIWRENEGVDRQRCLLMMLYLMMGASISWTALMMSIVYIVHDCRFPLESMICRVLIYRIKSWNTIMAGTGDECLT